MIINPIEVSESDGKVKIQSLIEYSGKKKYLWYSMPKKFSQYVTTEKLDGFLVGVLLLAMRLGEDIEVKGAVSEKLYFNLVNSYMSIIQLIMPALTKVNLNPQYLDDGKTAKCEGAVGTGFSAGVDSFCTIYDHYFNAAPPAYKITHFVFLNVGSNDEWDSERGRKIFNARYALLKGYPSELGLEFIKIDSNLSDILKWNFEQTFVPRNISAILMLQKLFAKYYLSSSYKYEDCVIKPNYEIGLIDPIAVHLLSTETLECISTGSQYSRVEKTRRMAKVPGANRWLNVCASPSLDGKNCSTCYKCLRTLFTLEILGILEDFAQVFSLDKWHRVKNQYMMRVLGDKKDRYIKEIRDYANRVNYPFKPWHIVASKILHFTVDVSDMSLSTFLKAIAEYIHLLR
ncbi:MAG: hypothetical protein ACFFDI_20390 [Promethearchaeota archaeon]